MTQQKGILQGRPENVARLEFIRKRLSPLQAELLNDFWRAYLLNGKWPQARTIHSQKGKKEVINALNTLGGDIVFEERDSSAPGRHYELTLIGVLLTSSGEANFKLLVRYIEHLRTQYKEAPEKLMFSADDFRQALDLNSEQTKMLGQLVRMSRLWNGGGYGDENWSIHVPDEVEDLPATGPLDGILEDFLFRWFQEDRPVLREDRQKQFPLKPLQLVPNLDQDEQPAALTAVDALKRRYQVFVSSTYEDLKEERQHVIQALLETKCIPLGMELFPAASVEQWQLIRRVIDECDYYIVIVGGRYGSLSDAGIGYTEMEFDYAISIGKPVIGFYHKNPSNLPGTKLEKNDAGRKQLEAFTEKVKRKLCRPWESPAELGSAVKSAILNELEFNPKPGWIRADAAPNSEAVEKLKQKIADLEEKLKKRKPSQPTSFPEGSDAIELTVRIGHDFVEDDWSERQASKHFEIRHQTTWDKILLMLKADLLSETSLRRIRYSLSGRLSKLLEPEITRSLKKANSDFNCSLESPRIDVILKTFMAKKLVSFRVDLGEDYYEDSFWKFTAKGLQYLAELEAIRASS